MAGWPRNLRHPSGWSTGLPACLCKFLCWLVSLGVGYWGYIAPRNGVWRRWSEEPFVPGLSHLLRKVLRGIGGSSTSFGGRRAVQWSLLGELGQVRGCCPDLVIQDAVDHRGTVGPARGHAGAPRNETQRLGGRTRLGDRRRFSLVGLSLLNRGLSDGRLLRRYLSGEKRPGPKDQGRSQRVRRGAPWSLFPSQKPGLRSVDDESIRARLDQMRRFDHRF